MIVSSSEWAKNLNNYLSDIMIKEQALELAPDPQIHILNIDDYSVSRLSQFLGKFPWPRAVYAELLEWFDDATLDAVVFDIIFSEQDVRMQISDAAFNDAIAESGNVFLAAIEKNANKGNIKLNQLPKSAGITATESADHNASAELLLPWAVESELWKIGAINFYPDSDGVGRRYQLYRNLSGWHFPTLPQKVAHVLGYNPPSTSEFILQWRGGTDKPFSECSFFDVYTVLVEGNEVKDAPEHCQNEQSIIDWLSSGILIIGNTSTGVDDFRKTPIADFYPGVYLLATAIDNLKNNNSLQQVALPIHLFLLILPIVALSYIFFSQQKSFKLQLYYALGFVVTINGFYLIACIFALHSGYIIPIAYTLVANCIALAFFTTVRGLEEHFNRQKTVVMFNRFMDPEVVDELLKKGELKPELDNQTIEITVLFSDIRGFTSLSEKHDAETIVRLLNRYFSRQLKAIFRHHGTLDKFIGDAVMAFWGAPLKCHNHAELAVSAAMDMEVELDHFKKEMGEIGKDFDIGIGIHTGKAVVGMIGSEQRYDYTCIGDTVNLASRIEGVTKGVSRILISETTRKQCGAKFDFEEKGSYNVKGREKEVKLFAPLRR